MAYILDPRYIGSGMSNETYRYNENLIYSHPSEDSSTISSMEIDARQRAIFDEIKKYRIQALNDKKSNNFNYRRLRDSLSPLEYWQTEGEYWPLLQPIALRLFSMVASSASSERNFSTFGFIHQKLRNSLEPHKVMQLVYIKTNYPIVSKIKLAANSEENDCESEPGCSVIEISSDSSSLNLDNSLDQFDSIRENAD
jgi:hypothetical protein